MRLIDLPTEEILKRILESDKLREKFDNALQDSEMDYIAQILSYFNTRCADWSIGLYNSNYFRCRDASEFVYCAREMADSYGASEKTLKILDHVEKLRGTNLFEHYAYKLADCIESDLCDMCRRIEDMSYDISCGKATPALLDFCEWWAEYGIDDVLIDEDNEKMYQIVYL